MEKKKEISLIVIATFIVALITLMATLQGNVCEDARSRREMNERTILGQYDTNCLKYINSPIAEQNRQRLEAASGYLLDGECNKALIELEQIDRTSFCGLTSVPLMMDYTLLIFAAIIILVFIGSSLWLSEKQKKAKTRQSP